MTNAIPVQLAAPVPPEKPLPLLEFMRVTRENGVAGIPTEAYRKPIYKLRHALGSSLIISDPAGVKRILLDNVTNYPKEPQTSRIMGAAFGEGLLTSDEEKWRSHRRIMADGPQTRAYPPDLQRP